MKFKIHSRWLGVVVLVLVGLLTLASLARAADDWKGSSDPSEYALSAMTGLGVIDSSVGLALLGGASRKIVHQGFIPDINNSVWIEVLLGPVLISGAAEFAYSTHLRWDFVKDDEWALYAVGGLGGYFTEKKMGSNAVLFPRFGTGAFWSVTDMLTLRGEISHEWITAGVAFFI